MLINKLAVTFVFTLAALLSAVCEKHSMRCWEINMKLFQNVLEALRQLKSPDYQPTLLWPSSIAAFGPLPGTQGSYQPGNEYPLHPTTMYGETKAAKEAESLLKKMDELKK